MPHSKVRHSLSSIIYSWYYLLWAIGYDTVCLLEQQQVKFNQLPIRVSDVCQETTKDPVLSKV